MESKDRCEYIRPPQRNFSAPRLNNWSFALANWRLAFADATSKSEGENYRTHRDQQFSHRESPRANA